ncbi:MAG: hypothetical protein NUV34_09000, partial [Sulfuricaulis sp.]|nr:hypothetical protein [Sulfuricaulis sp.]
MSNLRKHEMQDTSVLHLRDAEDELMYADGPDGEPDHAKPMKITLYGPGSIPFQKSEAERNNRLGERYRRKGKLKLSAGEALRERAEFVAGVTHSVENIDSDTGATGEALHMEVYSNPKLSFIAEQ